MHDGKGKAMTGCIPKVRSADDKRSLLMKLSGHQDKNLRCNIKLTVTAYKKLTALQNAFRICEIIKNDHAVTASCPHLKSVVRCSFEPTGERMFFDEWEHYWAHCMTPVFFGYSTEDHFKTRTKHKVLLGPPKVKVKKDRQGELEVSAP